MLVLYCEDLWEIGSKFSGQSERRSCEMLLMCNFRLIMGAGVVWISSNVSYKLRVSDISRDVNLEVWGTVFYRWNYREFDMSVCLSVCLSHCLSVCLSVCLCAGIELSDDKRRGALSPFVSAGFVWAVLQSVYASNRSHDVTNTSLGVAVNDVCKFLLSKVSAVCNSQQYGVAGMLVCCHLQVLCPRIFTRRRSVANSVGCFQRRLFVCLSTR